MNHGGRNGMKNGGRNGMKNGGRNGMKNGGRNGMKNGGRKCIMMCRKGFFKKEVRIGSFGYAFYPNRWAEKREKH